MPFDQKKWDAEYYQKNRQKKLDRAKERVTCEICGTVYPRGHKSHHFKTDYHESRK